MQAFHQRNILIKEQKVSGINPLYKLAQPRHITSYTFPHPVYFRTVKNTHINKCKSSQFRYDLYNFYNHINTVLIHCYSLQT